MKQYYRPRDLARLAKQFRKMAGKKRAQAAREMGVSQASIFGAEETPQEGLLKLRLKMIQTYSGKRVIGPVFFLRK